MVIVSRFDLRDARCLTELDKLLVCAGREHMYRPGDEPGPSGLVASTEPRPVVAMKILVEQNVVAPVFVLLKLARPAVNRSPAIVISKKNADQALRDLLCNLNTGSSVARNPWDTRW
jgi:hypothetical protein